MTVNRLTIPFLSALLFLLATLLGMPHALANDEDYYSDETYGEESYAEESYAEEPYVDEPYLDESASEEPYEESYQEPPMDSDQAAMVNQARTNCQQWAAESGLEGEDKTLFVEDCVYSQTGF